MRYTDQEIDLLYEGTSPLSIARTKIIKERKQKLEQLKNSTKKALEKMREQKRNEIEKCKGEKEKTNKRNAWDNKIYDYKQSYYKKREQIKSSYSKKLADIKKKYAKLNESEEETKTYWLPPCLWLDMTIGHNTDENSKRCKSYLSDDATLDIVTRRKKKYLKVQCTEEDFKNLFDNITGDIKWSYIAKKMHSDESDVQTEEFYETYHSE